MESDQAVNVSNGFVEIKGKEKIDETKPPVIDVDDDHVEKNNKKKKDEFEFSFDSSTTSFHGSSSSVPADVVFFDWKMIQHFPIITMETTTDEINHDTTTYETVNVNNNNNVESSRRRRMMPLRELFKLEKDQLSSAGNNNNNDNNLNGGGGRKSKPKGWCMCLEAVRKWSSEGESSAAVGRRN